MENREQIALVTGASSGIGKEIASRLLKDGLRVIGAARRLQQMDDLKSEGAHTFAFDIADEKSRNKLIFWIMKEFGGVDVLVNNAGFGLYGAVEDIPLEDARYQLDVNLFGTAEMIKLLVPQMREKGAGKIINISSMGGKLSLIHI